MIRLYAFALLFLAFSTGVANANVVFFPPENASECKEGSALTWDGKGNVKCKVVALAEESMGTPMLVKILPPYLDYNVYNSKLITYINSLNILPASKVDWIENCTWVNGQSPSATKAIDDVNWEYCGRFLCAIDGGIDPAKATLFTARLQERCAQGGSSDCNGGNFYISWSCFSVLKK